MATGSRPTFFRSVVLATGLLGTLAGTPIAYTEEPPRVEEVKPPQHDITGNYQCTIPQKGLPKQFSFLTQFDMSICKNKQGKLRRQIGFDSVPITQGEGSAFTFTTTSGLSSMIPNKPVTGNGHITDDGKLVYTETLVLSKKQRWSDTITCRYKTPCKDDLMRVVFIRPCEGQLYVAGAFDNIENGEAKTTVGPGTKDKATNELYGTVTGVCKDLKTGGTTDIFLPFKVDHEGKGCGNYGELLYPSGVEGAEVSASFQKAHKVGFDPIGAIIANENCKGMRFHAWFPVFHDPVAVKIAGGKEAAGQKAVKPKGWIEGIIDWAIDFFTETDYDYASPNFADPANAKVVDYELALLSDIIEKYPTLAGVNLDYIRYAEDWDEKQPGVKDGRLAGSNWIVDPQAVTDFVKKAREAIKGKNDRLVLSGDIMWNPLTRISVSQENAIPEFDVIVPMMYSGMFGIPTGIAGQIAIAANTAELRLLNQDGLIVPLLRGWSLTGEPADIFKAGLRDELGVVRFLAISGYGIFTYESMLKDATRKNAEEKTDEQKREEDNKFKRDRELAGIRSGIKY